MKPVAISAASTTDADTPVDVSTVNPSADPEAVDAALFNALLYGEDDENRQASQHSPDTGGEEVTGSGGDVLATSESDKWPSETDGDSCVRSGMDPDNVVDSENVRDTAPEGDCVEYSFLVNEHGEADADEPHAGGGEAVASQRPVYAVPSPLQLLPDAHTTDGPVAGVPAERSPVPNAPVLNAPVLNAPVPNAPVPNAPVPNAPVPNAPVPDAPLRSTPVLDVPVMNVPVLAEQTSTEPNMAGSDPDSPSPLQFSSDAQMAAAVEPNKRADASGQETPTRVHTSDNANVGAGEQVPLAATNSRREVSTETGGGDAQGQQQESAADDGLSVPASDSSPPTKHAPDVGEQHPVATLGDAVLAGLSRESVAPSRADVAPDRGRLTSLVSQVVERVLVSEKTAAGEGKVRLTLKDAVLPGTEVVVAREGASLAVRFLTRSDESSAWLHSNQRLICDELSQNLNCQVSVDISGEQQDGRSRGQRDLFAEMAETED